MSFTFEANNKPCLSLLEAAESGWFSPGFSLIFRYFLAEGFSNYQRDLIVMSLQWVIEIGEVGHQFILYVGIILMRYKGTWNVLRDLNRERKHVLSRH